MLRRGSRAEAVVAPERWQRLKTLFTDAAERELGERQAFLAAACVGDPELLAEVESLLDSDAEELELADASEPGMAMNRIGPYQVLRRIGSGGMSQVYLAARADDQYQKRVAIKLIRSGMDSHDARRRLRLERQILAGLEHPLIARLYDGGTTADGLPYFVMEYIEGRPLDSYCDRHRLSIRQRLELFRTVCSAVDFAHQNLVLHRDLKPGNILVTAEGAVKLLDFGIAKLLNPELTAQTLDATAPSLQPLTPSYSSPEQVRGEPVTTASDVYALGVLLYELLTGQPPYAFEDRRPRQIERVVCEAQPRRPSQAAVEPVGGVSAAEVAELRGSSPRSLGRQLQGDLDAIVLKALEKEPRDRYVSVERLSEDLRRHLEHRSVTASRGAFAHRARKFVRRHRLALAGLALAAAFTVAMTVQSVWLARALTQAEEERGRSERISAFMIELFEVADPETVGGNAVTVRQMLDRGAEKVVAELGGEPRVQAGAMAAIGLAYRNLGIYQQAEPLLRGALELRREALGSEHPEVATSLHDLGMLHHVQGDYRTAESLHRQGLELRLRHFEERHPLVASSLHDLAEAIHTLGDYDAAEELYRRALVLRRELLGDEHREVAESLSELAFLLQDQGDYDGALELLEEALAMHRRLFGEEHGLVANDLDYLGWTLQQKGEYERAESFYRQSLAMRRRLLGEVHPSIATLLDSLGLLLYQKGDLVAAEPLLRESLKVWRQVRSDDHPHLGNALNNLALVLEAGGDPVGAAPLFRRALDIYQRFLGPEHVAVAPALENLAGVLATQGDRGEAEALYRESLRIKRQALPAEHPMIALSLRSLGQFLLDGGQAAAAETLLRESVEIYQGALPTGDWRIADATSRLGGCLVAQSRFTEAEPLLRAGALGLQASRGEGDRLTLAALERTLHLYEAWSKPEEAAAYRQLLAVSAPPAVGVTAG